MRRLSLLVFVLFVSFVDNVLLGRFVYLPSKKLATGL